MTSTHTNESAPMPGTHVESDTGTAGRDRTTEGAGENVTDAYVLARMRYMLATCARARADAEEGAALAEVYRASGGEHADMLAATCTLQAETARAEAEAIRERIVSFADAHPGITAAVRRFMSGLYADVGGLDGVRRMMLKTIRMFVDCLPAAVKHEFLPMVIRRPESMDTALIDFAKALRQAFPDLDINTPPKATTRIYITHDRVHVEGTMRAGFGTASASRTWLRSSTGGWRSTSQDFAQDDAPAIGIELAEFLDSIALPTRVADMLPQRRHGADVAEHAAAAKQLAQG